MSYAGKVRAGWRKEAREQKTLGVIKLRIIEGRNKDEEEEDREEKGGAEAKPKRRNGRTRKKETGKEENEPEGRNV